MNWGFISGKGRKFSPEQPHQLWGPPNIPGDHVSMENCLNSTETVVPFTLVLLQDVSLLFALSIAAFMGAFITFKACIHWECVCFFTCT
jgi:hypothetical protein